MKPTIRILFAVCIVLLGTSAFSFSDGFEARASTCWTGVKTVDATNDTQTAILVKPGALVCLDGAAAKFECVLDPLGLCKREGPPVPPQPGIPACNVQGIADGRTYVQPAGFTGHMVTWAQLLSGATFPNGKPYLSPTGSYTLRSLSPSTQGPTLMGRWFATEIVPQSGKNYMLSWVQAQRQVSVPGYNPARGAHNVFISISRCAGDLRPGSRSSTDPSLRWCRAFSPSSQLSYGTTGASGQCPLQAGVKYYITFAFVDPSDGLDAMEHTCIPAAGRCEVNLNAR